MKYLAQITLIILFLLFSSHYAQDLNKSSDYQSVQNLLNSVKVPNNFSKNYTSISDFQKGIIKKLEKVKGHKDRKYYFMNGNKISTNIYNYGGIAPGYGLLRNVNNVVWRGFLMFSNFVLL